MSKETEERLVRAVESIAESLRRISAELDPSEYAGRAAGRSAAAQVVDELSGILDALDGMGEQLGRAVPET